MCCSVVLGVGSGLLSRYLEAGATSGVSADSALTVTLPVETAAGVAGILLAILVASYVARDAPSGLVSTSLTLVPRRSRLLAARGAAVAFIGVAAALVGTSATAVAAIAGSQSTGALPSAAAGIAASALAVGLLTSISFCVATLANRPVPTVLIVLGLLVVAPLALSAVQLSLPPNVGQMVGTVVECSPAPLFFRAIGITATAQLGYQPLIAAQLGLLAWAVVLGSLSLAVFKRRDG
jgi:ABC-type transport system involved in multi-copper enzyme maturation permease subunit